MVFQVLVDEQGVQGGGIEPGEEHVDHDGHIDFPVFHSQGEVFVVVLEFLGSGVVVGLEIPVVVGNRRFQVIARNLG